MKTNHNPDRQTDRQTDSTWFNLKSSHNSGFTIVELLVTIIIIAILAAVVTVSYRGITSKANEAALTADLSNAKKQLALYFAENNTYPTALDGNKCPSTPKPDTNYCLKSSTDITLTYNGNETTFNLNAKKGDTTYGISSNSSPIDTTQPTDCPTGFIPVPGSATYGTKGFCVMKYEAKQVGTTTTPISTSTSTPWVSITQTAAIANAPNVAGCTGCHLVTEAQWMTIAQNVLSVNGNWSGGTVGNGYIYRGHSDNAPANALAADTSDVNGYAGETNTGGSQKRTLTLTNGEVIWDMAGNVWEWTSGQASGTASQPGVIGAGFSYYEWPNITNPGSLAIDPSPAGTGLAGANTWTTGSGVGILYSSSDQAGLRGFIRGGAWYYGAYGGILNLTLDNSPSYATGAFGFRVAR